MVHKSVFHTSIFELWAIIFEASEFFCVNLLYFLFWAKCLYKKVHIDLGIVFGLLVASMNNACNLHVKSWYGGFLSLIFVSDF